MDYLTPALKRRIKVHIRAKEHEIEVIVPPQWQYLCEEELISLGYAIEKKGESCITLRGRIWDGYKISLWLRTASRVSIKIAFFKAKTSDKLLKKLQKIPWELWLNPSISLKIYSNVEYSKIRHEGLAKEILLKAIRDRFQALNLSYPQEVDKIENEHCNVQRLWINILEDLCSIKMDIVGNHLHQRGYRLEPGKAPLRETLASAILEFSNWKGERPLIDGMTGSGTLAIEAVTLAKNIAPGLRRSFLFEKLPFFLESRWLYEKKKAFEAIKKELYKPVIAIDKDAKSLEVARRNAERAGVSEDIIWVCEDFFRETPESLLGKHEKGLVVMNPPYGRRFSTHTIKLYKMIKAHLKAHYQGWQVSLIVPGKDLLKDFKEFNPTIYKLPHGGLWVYLTTFWVI